MNSIRGKLLFSLSFLLIQMSEISFSSENEFKSLAVRPQNVKCVVKDSALYFSNSNFKYISKAADKGAVIESCQKIEIEKDSFYSITYIFENQNNQGIHIRNKYFEIVRIDGSKLNKVRMDDLDQVTLEGDLPDYKFEKKFIFNWGESNKDKLPMLRIDITFKNGEIYKMLMKFNPKNYWFVDVL